MATATATGNNVGGALAEFTRRIAGELVTEAPELPGFPEVAVRVRKALSDDNVSVDAVVRVISAEPSLAVRLLQLSNSVALNPSGQRVTSLRSAVSRIGFSMARSLTMAFAMSQMRRAEAWRGLEAHFGEIWSFSARLAATSHALARRCGRADADEAMLAAMLHAVGKLFVLTRLGQFPVLLADVATYREIESAWHARASRALLARWDLSAEVFEGACGFSQPSPSGAPTLGDVLCAAHQLMGLDEADELTRTAVLSGPLFGRLGFDVAAATDLLVSSAADVDSLRAALAD
jgi:HD-like signal output (HDOD) protein